MTLPKLEFSCVTEVERLSPDAALRERFFGQNKPLVIETESKNWSFAAFAGLYGDREVQVHNGLSMEPIRIDALIECILGEAKGHYYQHELDAHWAADLVGRFFAEAWFPEPETVYLWAGGAEAGGIGLHQDDGYRNLIAQVAGTKHCILVSPAQSHLLSPTSLYPGVSGQHPLRYDSFRSQVTHGLRRAHDVDWKRFPRLREAHAYVCILNPGDCLSIPTSWFHMVTNLGPSLSVSLRWSDEGWLHNRRMFYALLDLALSHLRSLPASQREAFASRAQAELDGKSFVGAEILGGVVPPPQFFGWQPVRHQLLKGLSEVVETMNGSSLEQSFPLAFVAAWPILAAHDPAAVEAGKENVAARQADFIAALRRAMTAGCTPDAVTQSIHRTLIKTANAARDALHGHRTNNCATFEQITLALSETGLRREDDALSDLHERVLALATYT